MVILKHVSLLLVEKLNALLCVAEKHIFSVNDNFGTSLGSVNASKDFKRPAEEVSENDLFFTVYRLVGLLKKDALWNKVSVVQVQKDLCARCLTIHHIENLFFTSLEGTISQEFLVLVTLLRDFGRS